MKLYVVACKHDMLGYGTLPYFTTLKSARRYAFDLTTTTLCKHNVYVLVQK